MASNPSMNIPGDFQVESEALARRQAVIASMMASGARNPGGPEGQMVSGHYVAPSPLAAMAPALQILAGQYAQKGVDAKSAENNQNYQAGLGGAVKQYMDTRNGYSKQIEMQGAMPDGTAMPDETQQVKGDPRAAIVQAMTSQYKPLQQLGAAELTAIGKGALTQKDLLGLSGYSPQSKVAAALGNDPSVLQGEMKEHVVNGQIVRSDAVGAPTTAGDYRDKFGDPGVIGAGPEGKPMFGQLNTGTNEAKFLPQGTSINVNTDRKGAEAFAVDAGQAAVKGLVESTATAKKAQVGFETFANAKAQLAQMPGGTGSTAILAAKKLGTLFGMQDDGSITSMEQVGAALGQAVMDNASVLGTGNGFTDNDRKFLQEIVLGKVTLDKPTLERAVNLGLASNLNALRSHDSYVQGAGRIQGATPEVMQQFKVPIPEFALPEADFQFNPSTNRFNVRSSRQSPITPANGETAPTQQQSGLSPAEAAELQQLRQQFGRK